MEQGHHWPAEHLHCCSANPELRAVRETLGHSSRRKVSTSLRDEEGGILCDTLFPLRVSGVHSGPLGRLWKTLWMKIGLHPNLHKTGLKSVKQYVWGHITRELCLHHCLHLAL